MQLWLGQLFMSLVKGSSLISLGQDVIFDPADQLRRELVAI